MLQLKICIISGFDGINGTDPNVHCRYDECIADWNRDNIETHTWTIVEEHSTYLQYRILVQIRGKKIIEKSGKGGNGGVGGLGGYAGDFLSFGFKEKPNIIIFNKTGTKNVKQRIYSIENCRN